MGDAARVELLLTTRAEPPWGDLFALGCFVTLVGLMGGLGGIVLLFVAMPIWSVALLIAMSESSLETVVVEEDALVLLESRLWRGMTTTRLEWPAIARVVSVHEFTAPTLLSVCTRDGRIFDISFIGPGGQRRRRLRFGSGRRRRPPSRARFEPLINRTGVDFSAHRDPRELALALCKVITRHGVEHETKQADTYPRVKYWRD